MCALRAWPRGHTAPGFGPPRQRHRRGSQDPVRRWHKAERAGAVGGGRGHDPPPDTPFALQDSTVGRGVHKGPGAGQEGRAGTDPRRPQSFRTVPAVLLGGCRTREASGAALWARASRPFFTAEERDPALRPSNPGSVGVARPPTPLGCGLNAWGAAELPSGFSALVSRDRWSRWEPERVRAARVPDSGVPKRASSTVPSLLDAAPWAPSPGPGPRAKACAPRHPPRRQPLARGPAARSAGPPPARSLPGAAAPPLTPVACGEAAPLGSQLRADSAV